MNGSAAAAGLTSSGGPEGGGGQSPGQGGGEVCAQQGETLVTSLEGAEFPSPGTYQGGESPDLDLDAPDANWTYNDPHVLKVGDEYWMYASATDDFDYPVRLYRLLSNDGERWHRDPEQPILEPAASGAFDAGGVETPAVVYFRGAYHLFYTGYPTEVDDLAHSVLDYRVGHAVSCDGVHFEREATPLVVPSGEDDDSNNDWFAFVVAEPGPVVVGDELFVYFTALGADRELGTSLQSIGLIRTSDGTSWADPELVLRPDQELYPRTVDPGPPLGGWVGYSTPSAILLGERIHLFFDVAYDADGSSWRQVRLHHAVSGDGRTAFEHDAGPILSAGDFEWITDEVRSPQALVDGAVLRLYFAGHHLAQGAPFHFGIGMLTANLTP